MTTETTLGKGQKAQRFRFFVVEPFEPADKPGGCTGEYISGDQRYGGYGKLNEVHECTGDRPRFSPTDSINRESLVAAHLGKLGESGEDQRSKNKKQWASDSGACFSVFLAQPVLEIARPQPR